MNNNTVYWLHQEHENDISEQGYIGITNNLEKRLYSHSYPKSPCRGVKKVLESGVEMLVTIIAKNLSREQAENLEATLRPTPNIGLNILEGGEAFSKYKKLKKSLSSSGHSKLFEDFLGSSEKLGISYTLSTTHVVYKDMSLQEAFFHLFPKNSKKQIVNTCRNINLPLLKYEEIKDSETSLICSGKITKEEISFIEALLGKTKVHLYHFNNYQDTRAFSLDKPYCSSFEKLLIKPENDKQKREDFLLEFCKIDSRPSELLRLAEERGVPISRATIQNYKRKLKQAS